MPNVNKNVDLIPTQLAWRPYDVPSNGTVDFIGGLKTIMGSGDVRYPLVFERYRG